MLEETELKVEPTSQRNCTVTEVAETYALCFATIGVTPCFSFYFLPILFR